MPYIQLNEKQFPLRIGETSVGTAGADIPVEGPPALGVQAKLQVSNDNSVSIRRASSEAVVRVNGVQLGVEPTPLIHGDKIAIASSELLFGDDKKSGQTQHLAGLKVDDLLEDRAAPSGKRTAGTGGRLVSLVDGREYTVGATGVTIGRDAGCDVVVPSPEVSRKHAELIPGADGYAVSDLSTNGVFVNGQRVKGAQALSRGDVIRIGTEEFRFYADAARTSGERPMSPPTPGELPPLPPTARVSTPVPGMAAINPSAPSAARPTRAADRAPTPPAPSPRAPSRPDANAGGPVANDTRPVLATVEIMNEGPMKGTRFELRAPLTHVGRGAHNDIVLPDDTVSDSHAKIQRREAGWFVVDMGSSNGTYCGGQRIAGEASLTGMTALRFGGIRASFTPAQEARQDASGTRVIAGLNVEQARKIAREPAVGPATLPPDQVKSSGVPAWVWAVVLVLVAAAAFFILKVR